MLGVCKTRGVKVMRGGHVAAPAAAAAHRACSDDAVVNDAMAGQRRQRMGTALLSITLCAATCVWWAGAASSTRDRAKAGLLGVGVPLPLPGFQLPVLPTVADARTESDYTSTMDRMMSSFGGHDAAVAALRGRLAAGDGQFRGRQQVALLKSRADRSETTSRVLGPLRPGDKALRAFMASSVDSQMGSPQSMGEGFHHITAASAAASSVLQRGGSSGYAEQSNLLRQISSVHSLNGMGDRPAGAGDAASAAAQADSIFKGGSECLSKLMFYSLFPDDICVLQLFS